MSEKGRVFGATGGALGLGGFAAVLGLCCTVPWAVALLGVSGAVAFARLAFLQPYALIGSAALLAVGFWWAYWRPADCDEGDCKPSSRRLLQWVVWITTAIVAALGVIALRSANATEAPANSGFAQLVDSASELRRDFNAAQGTVRLLFVVDPICPVCLRGLDDLNRDLLARTDDANLRTFVVHVPVLGGEAKDIPLAAELLENPRVRHYWNSSGEFGRQLAEAVGLRRDDELVYAWDVWLIYGPEATWSQTLPPKPLRLMHQLPALRGSTEFARLDSELFARDVQRLLGQLSAKSPG